MTNDQREDVAAVNREREAKHPDAVLRGMVDALFDHANARGLKLNVEIRWPDGMQVKQRTMSDRERKEHDARLEARKAGQKK